MVSVPVASEMVAVDETFDKVRVTVSLASSRVSSSTGTVKVPVVSPALMVNVVLLTAV